MSNLLYIFSFLFVMLILVLVHEFGHFLVARIFNVKIERFSIGFGKPFYRRIGKKTGTEYAVAPFLIGGYVKLFDTRDVVTSPNLSSNNLHLAYDRKPILQRLAIIIAGPFSNIIFALIAFWIIFCIGFEVPKPIIGKITPNSIADHAGLCAGEEIIRIDKRSTRDWEEVVIAMLAYVGDSGGLNVTTKSKSIVEGKTYQLDLTNWKIDSYDPNPTLAFGIVHYIPQIPPIIGKIVRNSPAAKADLQIGDNIIEVSGKKINDWKDFIRVVETYPEKPIRLLFNRNGSVISLVVKTSWKFGARWKKVGFLGISPVSVEWPKQMLRQYKCGMWSAFNGALHKIGLFIDLNSIVMGKLLTGKISLHVLGGPISIFIASGQVLKHSFVMFLNFLAIISLSLALINLLPLPGLDGGHVILLLIESITCRPISMRVQTLILRLGIALFIVLILQVTLNDLTRIF